MRSRLSAFRCGCVLGMVLSAASASAETRQVRAGDDLQGALNAAQPGDVLLLEPGAVFVGNFVLPEKAGAAYITVRTDGTGLTLPASGNRIQPSQAGPLAKLRSSNTQPALRAAPRAHHWRLQLLEFPSNYDGYGDIIKLGEGTQTLADVPSDIEIDRCYIHGDPVVGQKRGVSLQSRATAIVNSYIADIKGVGMDTQAIGGWNGPGPYLIDNNYLEGAGENVMFGGSDPSMAGLVPSDITFRRNHLRKPLEWRQPIVQTPTSVAAGVAGSGGLGPGTYVYRVAARRPAGQGVTAISAASPEISVVVSAGAAVGVTWDAAAGASEYRVYRRPSTSSSWEFWTVTGPSFTDAGVVAGSSGTPPAAGTLWTVKNLFELKNAQRVLVEGNLIENNWLAAQTGSAILMKSVNQDGAAPWSVVADVVVRHNIVRHVASALNVLGYGYPHPSQQLRNLSITNNLFYDVDSSVWAGDGRFMMLGDGAADVVVDHNTVLHNGMVMYAYGRQMTGFRFTNNVSLHNAYGIKGEARAVGNATLAAFFPGATMVANALAGGVATQYPAGNFFPPASGFLSNFIDAGVGDFRLTPSSLFRGAATDGGDIGADIETIEALTDVARSGQGAVNQLPTAAPGGPYSAPTLVAISFDGRSSADPDGAIVSYSWDWNDGSPSSAGPQPTHQYARAGTYLVTLTVTDDAGAQASATAVATVRNQPPLAVAGGPYTGQPGVAIAVSAGGSSDPDGSIASCRWQWDDGSPDTLGATASHVFAAAGDYTVTLIVTDDEGASTASTATVRVETLAPPEIVIYAAQLPATARHGTWVKAADLTAAAGARLQTADKGWASAAAPLANPGSYFDATFDAPAGVEYRVWLRLSAAGNSKWNDAVWVQFSDAIDDYGSTLYRTGTTQGLLVNLATTALGTSLNRWGWQNGAYWLQQTTAVQFTSSGTHTIRIQVREDGVRVDQIVLSPTLFFNQPPGPPAGDTTIVPKP